jgi:nucleoid DNA-binding protein
MNKAELISLVAAKADVTKVTTSSIIDIAMEAITETLAKGEAVQFVGFGTFSVAERKARTGRNPQTGKEITIPAKRVVRFKAGGALTDAANKPIKRK